MTKQTFSYYSFHDVLSRNGVYNFIVGRRGEGKTYGAKKYVIKNFLRDRKQFIYLRRFTKELSTRGTFFADIAHEFPGNVFRVAGNKAQICFDDTVPDKEREWHTMGYFVALSTSQTMKSVAYPEVTTIIFDEFIIEKGFHRYLPDETTVMNNFYSTVDRYQDKTRVLFLANSVSIMNPYFLEYDIQESGEFVVLEDGFIVVHFSGNMQFSKEVVQTKFGKFIANTQYGDYAMGNVFVDNEEYLLSFKNSNARYLFTLETKQGIFSVWRDNVAIPMVYYIQAKRPGNEIVFVTEPSLMKEDKVLLLYNDRILQRLRASFGNGTTLFDSTRTRNMFIQIFKR